MKVEQVAQLCHEMNRVYCRTMMDDMSQPNWVVAPDWQKESAINGVLFHLQNPEAGPEASHECWLEEKENAGWKFGPIKDVVKKEHPCFVPYDKLPLNQKAKDLLFIGVVNAFRDQFVPSPIHNKPLPGGVEPRESAFDGPEPPALSTRTPALKPRKSEVKSENIEKADVEAPPAGESEPK